MDSQKPLRVAVVGCGGMANSHLSKFTGERNVQIVACCDVLEASARQFAERHSIPAWYTDYRKLLAREQLDAVAVVTSDVAHAAVSIAAFKKGLHVLCEKPLATSLAEAKRMLAAAKASGKMHMVNFSYRPYVALERARQLVDEGRLGRIIHVEASYLQQWLASDAWGDWRKVPALQWRMSRKHRGGVLVDIGCHILIFTTHVVGDITSLQCRMKSFDKGVPKNTWKGYKLDADDSFAVTAEFASGAFGVIHATRWASGHNNALRLRVFGDKGALAIDTEVGKDKLQLCVGEFQARNLLWNTLTIPTPESSNYARFIRSIRTGKSEEPTFEDGVKIQGYLEACQQSAKSGKMLRVKL